MTPPDSTTSENFEWIHGGGLTTPSGFTASGVAAGLKASNAPDVGMLYAHSPCRAAGAFTPHPFAAAPVQFTQELVSKQTPVHAVAVNSGNANACTGKNGLADTGHIAQFTADLLDISWEKVLVCSTGIIGRRLPMDSLLEGIKSAAGDLSENSGEDFAEAIMTTDTRPKSHAVQLQVGGQTVSIGGAAKGAGMIAPRMIPARPAHATMLSFVTTDAAVDQEFLDECLQEALHASFNRITVDGESSTNDTFLVLANAEADNPTLTTESEEADTFREALTALVQELAKDIIRDAEGATRFVELRVSGAATEQEARLCAESIANSLLCKTAWNGGDPNWGRILEAAGNAEVSLDPENVALDYNEVPIVRESVDAGTSQPDQAAALSGDSFTIKLDLGMGESEYTIWTCDLSQEYVRINAEYHT